MRKKNITVRRTQYVCAGVAVFATALICVLSGAAHASINGSSPFQSITAAEIDETIDLSDGPDTDGDNIANQYDLDDDNDGILDSDEGLVDDNNDGVADAGSRDTDGDGVPDAWDLDSDNDGLLDNREAHPDFSIVSANDQVVNGAIDIGIEVGRNGVADNFETAPDSGVLNFQIQDTDQDGQPDYIDLDSDGDSIHDIIEAGGTDTDANGTIDGFSDADDKGVDDRVQASAWPIFDTDSDGIADYRDTDSDNDTLLDRVEVGNNPNNPTDTDNDGAADYREQDSDGDGIPDQEEVDIPVINAPENDDVDGDGVNNDVDMDADNDGLSNIDEGDGDSDGDRTLNIYDLDSDNDGVFDIAEAADNFSRFLELDTNQDGRVDSSVGENGFPDVLESTPDSGTSIFTVADSDGDGVPDFKDLDSDNDGIYDSLESGRNDTNLDGQIDSSVDTNSDGIFPGTSSALLDTDGDGIVDSRDLDSDNDGIPDIVEANGIDADVDGDGMIDSFNDANGDGADDSLQQRVPADLLDTDNDNVPDFRDLDSDQDGLSDVLEVYGPEVDANNDGVLDVVNDANGDGLEDANVGSDVHWLDTDRDGIPDQLDLDSDGDGISDLVEAGGVDTDNDGIVDTLADADADGIPNVVDVDVTRGEDNDQDGIDDMADVTFTLTTDTDADGIADEFDGDSDGNGFVGPLDSASQNQPSLDDGQGQLFELPDADNDGIPDIKESADTAKIQTGLAATGFGCSIASNVPPTRDPLLLLMFGAALGSLALRFRKGAASWRSSNPRSTGLRKAGLFAVMASSISLTACNSLPELPSLGGSGNGSASVNKRLYVGAGGLASQLKPEVAEDEQNIELDETQSAGGGIHIGYDISNRFSIEGHVADMGESTFSPDGSIGYQVGGLSALMYGLNDAEDRGNREGFSLYGRLGVGAMKNEGDGVEFERVNDYHVLGGLGMEYGFLNGLAMRAEIIAHDTDARYGQLAVLYRMGGEPHYSNTASTNAEVVIPTPMKTPDVVVEKVEVIADIEPQLDSDGDGIADRFDSCAGSISGTPVNAEGCALFSGAIEGVNFESGSDQLTSNAQGILSGVAETLNQYPNLRVSVDAHTDNQGSAASNLQLSKRRAVSVARYLASQGVVASRLQPKAFGESQPRETNETSAGRARNRRVELNVIQ